MVGCLQVFNLVSVGSDRKSQPNSSTMDDNNQALNTLKSIMGQLPPPTQQRIHQLLSEGQSPITIVQWL